MATIFGIQVNNSPILIISSLTLIVSIIIEYLSIRATNHKSLIEQTVGFSALQGTTIWSSNPRPEVQEKRWDYVNEFGFHIESLRPIPRRQRLFDNGERKALYDKYVPFYNIDDHTYVTIKIESPIDSVPSFYELCVFSSYQPRRSQYTDDLKLITPEHPYSNIIQLRE